MAGPLTEKQLKLFSLFKIAIEEERKAQKLYSEMLTYADDDSTKKLLEAFVRQEKSHEESLMSMYSELRRTEEYKDPTG